MYIHNYYHTVLHDLGVGVSCIGSFGAYIIFGGIFAMCSILGVSLGKPNLWSSPRFLSLKSSPALVSHEKRAPWLFRGDRGWNPTQLCGDYFINHGNKDPYETTRIQSFFSFRGSCRIGTRTIRGIYIFIYALYCTICSNCKKNPNLWKGHNTSIPCDLLIYLVILLTIPKVTSRIAKLIIPARDLWGIYNP